MPMSSEITALSRREGRGRRQRRTRSKNRDRDPACSNRGGGNTSRAGLHCVAYEGGGVGGALFRTSLSHQRQDTSFYVRFTGVQDVNSRASFSPEMPRKSAK